MRKKKSWAFVSDEQFIADSKNHDSAVSLARSYGLKRTTAGFRDRVEMLGITFHHNTAGISREQFAEAAAVAQSKSELIELLGWEVNGGRFRTVSALSREYGVPVQCGSMGGSRGGKLQRLTDDEFFVNGRSYSGSTVKSRMLRRGVPNVCSNELCPLHVGDPVWVGEPISLQVDHINGDHIDNRFENLRLLCPNCHAQTSTFGSKSARVSCTCGRKVWKREYDGVCRHSAGEMPQKNFCVDCGKEVCRGSTRCVQCGCSARVGNLNVDYPDIPVIIAGIKEMGCKPYAETIGVSDNGLRKHLRRNGCEVPRKLRKDEREN